MALAIIFDGVGFGEWFVLLAVVLVVVGPKRLPSAARRFGQYYAKFRRAADSFKRQILDMDTELTNSVRDAAREVENAANEVTNAAEDMFRIPDPIPPSPPSPDNPVNPVNPVDNTASPDGN